MVLVHNTDGETLIVSQNFRDYQCNDMLCLHALQTYFEFYIFTQLV